MRADAFVFVVCGDRHAMRLNVALKFLKRFSRADIIVVKARTRRRIACDRVIDCKVPAGFDNHKASIFLKTSLHRHVGREHRRYCYLDSDIIAVSQDVDAIFDRATRPIQFAQDHGNLRHFSPHAVNCGCADRDCEHLHAAIRKSYHVEISDKAWRHWNGGVFVFDESSTEFMETWHRFTLAAFEDPYWKTRDQGTLVATVWKLGLQGHPTLPPEFNYIVDRYKSVALEKRKTLKPRQSPVNDSYTLSDGDGTKPRPAFLHLINGGVGKRGWANWDDAEQLLKKKRAPAKRPAAPAALRGRPLSPDNRIVHSMWIGKTLTKMELLTLQSFLHQGHEFHLWAYDELDTPLPEGVVLEDADEIIPRERIIRKADIDRETGVGKGSVSLFSDLFRYRLLYEKGGYWVDMDVTCLKPLAFDTPYVFRAHRVGVVGNIMKCPPKSRLMKTLYEQVSRELGPDSDWLMANRKLSELVRRFKFTRYIRRDVWNEDRWDAIAPLALGTAAIPADWVAIHWINEFWRTLQHTGGTYKGQRLFDVAPDQSNPRPGSALAGLYARHGIPPARAAEPASPRADPPAPMNRPAERQPSTPQFFLPSHVNVMISSLARGGAERIVLENVAGLQRRKSSGKLFILNDARPSYPLENLGNFKAYPLQALSPPARLQAVAAEVLASPEQSVFTHLIRAEELALLWDKGVRTIPVIHNTRESWLDEPDAYNHPLVPFVVAVSEQVAQQLMEDGCDRRIVVVRHELQRWFTPESQQQHRQRIRDLHGIGDEVLLIGMVGEFKSQKAYTRAVRVLAELRKDRPVKLMILGGWDHDWGHGRQTYTATHHLAMELDVVPDLITPGSVAEAEQYYAAFDVFLNTSVHDGLSVSVLEAIQTGCPLVVADVGGNREVLPAHGVLVRDPSDTGAYVAGIRQVTGSGTRELSPKAPDHDLVPRLWCWLGRHGAGGRLPPLAERQGTLFLTDNLNIGGAQRSLVNLLGRLPEPAKSWLCVLDTVYGQGYLDELQPHGVPVISVHDAHDYLAKLERILSLIERLEVRNICFWNVDPRIKLLLAKIFPPGSLRLIDVSPGPQLFEEMEQARLFQRRIAFPAAEYWRRLDHFVAKYTGGFPPGAVIEDRKHVVIPNGVPEPTAAERTTPALPAGADPGLLVGTACRIMPGKRIEFFIDMMAELKQHLDGVNLVIVGGIDPRHADYWPMLMQRLRDRQVDNVHFAGPHHRITPFLRQFRVLVMLADSPGCPNVSLEAMALGIPVVANAAGGTGEQVFHGKNGFLVSGSDPKEMALRVCTLLTNNEMRRRFGQLARSTALKHFSMDSMVRRYRSLFEDLPSETRPSFKAYLRSLVSPT